MLSPPPKTRIRQKGRKLFESIEARADDAAEAWRVAAAVITIQRTWRGREAKNVYLQMLTASGRKLSRHNTRTRRR